MRSITSAYQSILWVAALAACSGKSAAPAWQVRTTAIAVDGDTLFAVTSTDDEHAKIVTCPVNDCGAPRELAAFDGRSLAIEVDGDAVYAAVTAGLHWRDGRPDARAARSQILRIGRKGGVETLLDLPIEEGEVMRALPDGDYLYVTFDTPNAGLIARTRKLPRAALERIAVLPTQRPYALAVDDRYVYWTSGDRGGEGGAVTRAPKTGGAPEQLARTAHMTRGIARSGDTLYVTTLEVPTRGKQGAVLAVPTAGGEPRVVLGDTDVAPAIAIADLRAYVFVEPTRNAWQLTALPLDGGAPSVIATGADVATGVAIAPGRVVFAHGDYATGRGGVGVRAR